MDRGRRTGHTRPRAAWDPGPGSRPCESGRVIAELTLGRLVPGDDRAAPRTWVVAAAAALRALTVGVSVVLLACGLALILWASAPESTAGAASAIQAGVVAFAAAHLVPVTLGGIGVTISPLLITGAVVGLLAAVTRRARLRPVGRMQEVVAVGTTAAVHGLFVSVVTRSFAPAGTVPPTAVLTAGGLALLAALWGTAAPGSTLRRWWSDTPEWLRLGARAGTAAAIALLAAGALAVVAGLVLSFSSVAALTGLTAPGVGAGLGLTVLQLLLLPNAAVAGTGYVTGVGFQLGSGRYSPLGSTVVDLPAVPVFAAAPEGVAASGAGLVWLVVPVLVAVLVGWWVAQRTARPRVRLAAVATAAVVAGGVLAVMAVVARGGVQGGPIAVTGAPVLLLGAVVAGAVAMIGGLTVLALRSSGARASAPSLDAPVPLGGSASARSARSARFRGSASNSRARRGRVRPAGAGADAAAESADATARRTTGSAPDTAGMPDTAGAPEDLSTDAADDLDGARSAVESAVESAVDEPSAEPTDEIPAPELSAPEPSADHQPAEDGLAGVDGDDEVDGAIDVGGPGGGSHAIDADAVVAEPVDDGDAVPRPAGDRLTTPTS